MTSGSFQPRRIGSHLLVAALGEDCLGTIFRALHATDEKRFVRFRILQSPELSPPAVFSAIARHGETVAHLSHKAIVQQAELAVADGSPYYAWYEGAGWTLDTVLLRLRSAGTALPAPFALLIAERVCAALEHAWFSPKDGEPIRHGLLWPGFVSISIDAEVRLGGFGLADAVLPSVMRGRLARDIAPYAAPEARESGRMGPTSDAYSAGVLLLELLTCRRPVTSARPEFRAEDGFTEHIQSLLDRCFAAPEDRPSILELHRALQEQLAVGASPVSSADLAYFLYTLLNPESRGVPTNDHESTNPISAENMEPFELATPFLGSRHDDPEEGVLPGAVRSHEAEAGPREASKHPAPGSRKESPAGGANARPSTSPPRLMTARRSAGSPDAAAERKAAEDARFQAAWARIEAERGEARELASDPFDRGRGQEAEGERLLRAGDHASAREAFERAAGAFREADDHSRQARLGRIRLSSPSS